MTENFSLAEQAVQALELVRNMDSGMALMNPERHSVRELKRLGKRVWRVLEKVQNWPTGTLIVNGASLCQITRSRTVRSHPARTPG